MKWNWKGLGKQGKGATLSPSNVLEELLGELKSIQSSVERESEDAKEQIGKLWHHVETLPLGEYTDQYLKPLSTQIQEGISAIQAGKWGAAIEPIKQAITLVSELIGKL